MTKHTYKIDQQVIVTCITFEMYILQVDYLVANGDKGIMMLPHTGYGSVQDPNAKFTLAGKILHYFALEGSYTINGGFIKKFEKIGPAGVLNDCIRFLEDLHS